MSEAAAAREVLTRQASLLLATQEHKMRLMEMRLSNMQEQLSIVPKANLLAGHADLDPPTPELQSGRRPPMPDQRGDERALRRLFAVDGEGGDR